MDNTVRVHTADLKTGMYVFELDRPWTETPFLFQGFVIQDEEQISVLQAHCSFVYVDKEQSLPETAQYLETTLASPVEKHSPKKQIKQSTFDEVDYRRSLVKSHGIYEEARGWVHAMLEDGRLGRGIDTVKARSLVTQLADQVMKDSDALAWLTHLKSRDEYTATHCVNTCILSLTFGRCLDLGKEELHQLGIGALLHDLGKMRVPDEILNKPGKLTKIEFEIISTHPSEGYAILCDGHGLSSASLHIVKHHHERLDGQGYPEGLHAEDIPELTRIFSIIDVYDAITSDRCYKDGFAPTTCLEGLFKWAPGNFDITLLEKFIKCVGIYPIGSVVQLNTGDIGMVVATDSDHRLKPIVLLIQNSKADLYQPRRLVNLSSSAWKDSGSELSIEDVLEPGAFGINTRAILQDELQVSAEQITRYEP